MVEKWDRIIIFIIWHVWILSIMWVQYTAGTSFYELIIFVCTGINEKELTLIENTALVWLDFSLSLTHTRASSKRVSVCVMLDSQHLTNQAVRYSHGIQQEANQNQRQSECSTFSQSDSPRTLNIASQISGETTTTTSQSGEHSAQSDDKWYS